MHRLLETTANTLLISPLLGSLVFGSAIAVAGECTDTTRTRNGSVVANLKVINDSSPGLYVSVDWQNFLGSDDRWKELKERTPLQSGEKIDVTDKNVNIVAYRITVEHPTTGKKMLCSYEIVNAGSVKIDGKARTKWSAYVCNTRDWPHSVVAECQKSYNSSKDRWNTKLRLVDG